MVLFSSMYVRMSALVYKHNVLTNTNTLPGIASIVCYKSNIKYYMQ